MSLNFFYITDNIFNEYRWEYENRKNPQFKNILINKFNYNINYI